MMIIVMAAQANDPNGKDVAFAQIAVNALEVTGIVPAVMKMHADAGMQVILRSGLAIQLHKDHDLATLVDEIEYNHRLANVRYSPGEFTAAEMQDA